MPWPIIPKWILINSILYRAYWCCDRFTEALNTKTFSAHLLIAGCYFVAMCTCLEPRAPHPITAVPQHHAHVIISMIALSTSLTFLKKSDRLRGINTLRSYYTQHPFCITKCCHCFTSMAWTTEQSHLPQQQ